MFSSKEPVLNAGQYVINFKQLIKNITEPLRDVGQKTGGTDIGFVTKLDDALYIVKSGITISLLKQAFVHGSANRLEKQRQLLGFIVGNFTRITGKEEGSLTDQLNQAVNDYRERLENPATDLELAQDLYRFITSTNTELGHVVTFSAVADVVFGAMGQFYNNHFQAFAGVSESHLDAHRLIIDDHQLPMMASRYIAPSFAFHVELLEPFAIRKTENEAEWLEDCKAILQKKLASLQGLGSAILLRLLMGESADLGPDNMMLVNTGGALQVVNIDVTGFRYARQQPFVDPKPKETRLGWESLLAETDAEKLTAALLDKSVFSKRFLYTLKDINHDAVMQVIRDVLFEILLPTVLVEKAKIVEWLSNCNIDATTAMLDETIYEVMKTLAPEKRPPVRYIHKLCDHASKFIQDASAVVMHAVIPAQAGIQPNSGHCK